MRAESLFLVLQCLLGFVLYSEALSTCNPLDLELIKRKRIEAIRGQILSKLRLPKEPEVDDEKELINIPAELISLYNTTVELNQEQLADPVHQHVEDPTEEDYYAKEVHKFTMKRSEWVCLFSIVLPVDYWNITVPFLVLEPKMPCACNFLRELRVCANYLTTNRKEGC